MKKAISNLNNGFTMIELLVTIGILGLVMVAATNLFFISLKSKNKTESITSIKQSGNYAIQIMSMMIRNAKNLTCDDTTQIIITNPDNQTTTFSCTAAADDSGRIASNSAKLVSNYVKSCNFSCDLTSNPNVATIDFTLAKGEATDILSYATQQFKTTVSLRNY